MNKDQLLHDISLAYLLYTSLCPDKPELSFEDFYQDYENISMQFEKIINHYAQ